jgi:predicted N-formylglutamate amidohydrolase
MSDLSHRLLSPDDPPAYVESNLEGQSNFFIVVDHASARIPKRLHDLGVPPSELARHIAWDIGALAVAQHVSKALNAPLIAQNYSRLVIDCNRDPKVPTSVPLISEHTEIPGNRNLSAEDLEARRVEIFEPYHRRIRELLDARAAAGRRTILLAQHTMTDAYKGSRREMHAAVLYNRDRTFAALMLEALRADPDIHVADNQPYFVSDETDYTVPVHAEARGLAHVEIEIRQDLVQDEAGQIAWAKRLADALQRSEAELLKTVA